MALVLSLVVLPLVLSACCGGRSAKVITPEAGTTTTLGQELKDLDEAHQKGIITDQQYEDAKQKLINKRTKK